jgi:hypothetical protein
MAARRWRLHFALPDSLLEAQLFDNNVCLVYNDLAEMPVFLRFIFCRSSFLEAMAWLQRDQGSTPSLLVNSTANQPAEFFSYLHPGQGR